MNALMQSQIFFFISSVGFVVLWIFLAVFLFYLIRATRSLSNIIEKAKKDIDEIGDTTKDMIEDMRDSMIFSFLFGKKKRHRKD